MPRFHRFLLIVSLAALRMPSSVAAPASTVAPTLFFDDQIHYERQIGPNEIHPYVITLKAGEFVHFVVQPTDVDVELAFDSPDGKRLSKVDQRGTIDPEILSAIAEVDGRYRLYVSSKWKGSGSYEVRVDKRRPAIAQDRNRIEAERLYAEGGDRADKATADFLRTAVDLYRRAGRLWQSVNDQAGESDSLNDLGIAQILLGEPADAVHSLERALAIRECIPELRSRAGVFSNLAIALQDLGRDRAAIAHSEAALRDPSCDHHLKAIALYMLGQAHTKLGDGMLALQYHLRAARLVEDTGDRIAEGRYLNRVGMAYAGLGQWREALLYYGRTLEVRRATGDKRGEALTLDNIGMLYRDWGDTARAIEQFEKTLVLARETSDRRTEAVALHHIGDAHQLRGESEKAIAYYEQALKLYRDARYRSDEALALLGLGRAHAAKRDFSRALSYYVEALNANRDRLQRAFIIMAAADAQSSSGRQEEAMISAEEAIEIFRSAGHQQGEAEALYTRARAYEAAGKLDEARGDAEASLRLIERLRGNIGTLEARALFLASYSEISDLYIRVLMRLHQDAQALQASERVRARTLIDFMRAAPARDEPNQSALLKRQREIRALLSAKAEAQLRATSARNGQEIAAAIGREMDALSAEYDQVSAQLRAASPRTAAMNDAESVDVAAMQREVVSGSTALLEYFLGEQKSFVWVVTRTSLHAYELPRREEIEAAVRKAYDALAARAASRESLLPLSRMILAQALAGLKAKRLRIVSDGALQYLPFAALPLPRDPSRPLITRYEIANIPSASTIALLRRYPRHSPATKTLAVFADPVFDANDERVRPGAHRSEAPIDTDLVRSAKESGLASGVLARLPFTRREANSLLELVPVARRKAALDFEANRQTALADDLRRYRIVHFATHGLVNSLHPELSGIVLSMVDQKGSDQRGFLSVADVFNMSLGADLVVLSGCRTALGKEVKGEGITGLTGAFMYAGAPRVVASLWKVNDAATAELMKVFYGRMLGPAKLSPSAALRAAQLSLEKGKRWKDPYYWAAFVIQGDPN